MSVYNLKRYQMDVNTYVKYEMDMDNFIKVSNRYRSSLLAVHLILFDTVS